MTENKALIATIVAMLSLVVAAWMGLALIDAREDVVVAVVLFIGYGGAFAVSAVVAHYAPPDEPKR